ncbi:hypothetical protein COLO4_04177 [Corchorus olitorius]|uniref:Uncharacterized protein n=1 Tax=Corchorus olitorius TaxID=93759 RepID=A0A1R3KV35_9ROSI|nr:hypothetical protein COLO4_04177 [Corchorus olitorius]
MASEVECLRSHFTRKEEERLRNLIDGFPITSHSRSDKRNLN